MALIQEMQLGKCWVVVNRFVRVRPNAEIYCHPEVMRKKIFESLKPVDNLQETQNDNSLQAVL
jgi:hypothetical protein